MSIKIHHGPPGAFKTSGAVMDDMIPALKEGRTVVTNIRGVSRERCLDVLPDIPETVEVISIDTQTAEGRKKAATWFHWVPIGAFVILDEAQSLFPKRWRDSDIKKLDFPGGVDAAAEAGRPHDWETAWDMHRHYNWDIVLTTPNIKKIRDDIRGAAEGAYKHANAALIGAFLRGRYKEGFHLAEDNGTVSQLITAKGRKVEKYVFELYDSTKTGAYGDTKAGQSILSNVRLLLALVVAVPAMVYGISGITGNRGGELFVEQAAEQQAVASVESAGKAALVASGRVVSSSMVRVGGYQGDVDVEPLYGSEMDIVGSIGGQSVVYLLAVSKGDTWVRLTSTDLRQMGYTIKNYGDCLIRLKYGDYERLITCGSRSSEYFSRKQQRNDLRAQRGIERGEQVVEQVPDS